MSKADREYYRTKVDKKRKQLLQTQRKQVLRQMLDDYIASQRCVDCGNTDPRVLEFDHVRGPKEFNIADGPRLGYSWERIRAEIDKCVIRCANCHRIRHYSK